MSDKLIFKIVILCALYLIWLSNTDIIYPPKGGFAYWPFVFSGLAAYGYVHFEGGRLLISYFRKNKQQGN
jgi:hypothetical protein